jgi:hypothetical protein
MISNKTYIYMPAYFIVTSDFHISVILPQRFTVFVFGSWQFPFFVASLKFHELLFCMSACSICINYPEAAAFNKEPLWRINKASILLYLTTIWVIYDGLCYHGCGWSVEIAVTEGSRSFGKGHKQGLLPSNQIILCHASHIQTRTCYTEDTENVFGLWR